MRISLKVFRKAATDVVVRGLKLAPVERETNDVVIVGMVFPL
jgi:hypothetical protein